jgi:hypothetical protein
MNPSLFTFRPDRPHGADRDTVSHLFSGIDKRFGQEIGNDTSLPVQPSRRIERSPRSDANRTR